MDYIYILKFIGVALSVGLADVCWVKYFLNIVEQNPLKSALYGVGLVVLGALSVEGYVNDSSLIIAAAIGAFFGTFIPIYLKNKKDASHKKNIN